VGVFDFSFREVFGLKGERMLNSIMVFAVGLGAIAQPDAGPGGVAGISTEGRARLAPTTCYEMVLLDPPPDSDGYVTQSNSANSSGQVLACYSIAGEFFDRSAIWQEGTWTPCDSATSQGGSINELGHVVYTRSDPDLYQAVFWDGAEIELGFPERSFATGLNDSDTVVGYCESEDGPWGEGVGYVWQAGVATTLPGFEGAGLYPLAINNDNVIVGYTYQAGWQFAAEWQRVDGQWTIAPLCTSHSVAMAVNDSGTAVGYVREGPGDDRPAIFSSDGCTVLDVRGWATSINAAGDVVGILDSNAGFLYRNGQLVELSSLMPTEYASWHIYYVSGISDNGWITGVAGSPDGECARGFILRPARPLHGSSMRQ
jgi:hypothetical protein